MAITNSTGWMITPPAIAMMRRTTPSIRSMTSVLPSERPHNLQGAQNPLTGWFREQLADPLIDPDVDRVARLFADRGP